MSDQTALSLRYYNAGSRIRWQGVLWHVESLKVASLSVRSAAPALLRTVTVSDAVGSFQTAVTNTPPCFLPSQLRKQVGWQSEYLFNKLRRVLSQKTVIIEKSNFLVFTLYLRHIVVYHMHRVPCSESPNK